MSHMLHPGSMVCTFICRADKLYIHRSSSPINRWIAEPLKDLCPHMCSNSFSCSLRLTSTAAWIKINSGKHFMNRRSLRSHTDGHLVLPSFPCDQFSCVPP
ncbi:hypothetical protein XELAEV_18009979mg [Xenopus laevis]|uniref:Uncharacterized protein n=1 Tax=Xenopus laevis TaxID=8355 RepID=A0A974DV09_XENLA|nr:hypothetical protein XELAEV_18009979mg [Xenopus laevis]